ncbi:MAG: GldG family protein, partial [Acidobacteriota bacterium]|nr:GldG family protein [Acidobacteriota bacterium]
MNSEWIKARQTKYGVYVTTYIIVIIAVLAAANWLANRHNKSIDTTANKRFSLSDQTKKVVSGLKSDVTITYFDKQSGFTAGKDVLDRYHNLSPKLHVNYVDPEKKPNLAKAAGIRNYGAITVENGSRREEAKSLGEEDVTGALIRVLKTGDRSACFVTGSGEPTIEDTGRSGYSGIKDALEKNNYKTRSISLFEKPEVPKDCTVLIVAGPKRDYIDPAVKAVKTYVEGGGHALFM